MWVLRRLLRKKKKRTRTTSARRDYVLHKERARVLVHERVAFWAPRIGVSPNRIAIRDQRSRWGSCSTKGNLNFNYRLVFLPIELVDYVIVHELCHLHEFNHSERFWGHVEIHLPEYPLHKSALREISRLGLSRKGNTAIVAA